MKVSVAVMVPAEKRRHTPVSISSEEFIKGTSYKSAGRTQSHLPGSGEGGSSQSPDTKSGSDPGQRVRVPNFHQQKQERGRGRGCAWNDLAQSSRESTFRRPQLPLVMPTVVLARLVPRAEVRPERVGLGLEGDRRYSKQFPRNPIL